MLILETVLLLEYQFPDKEKLILLNEINYWRRFATFLILGKEENENK